MSEMLSIVTVLDRYQVTVLDFLPAKKSPKTSVIFSIKCSIKSSLSEMNCSTGKSWFLLLGSKPWWFENIWKVIITFTYLVFQLTFLNNYWINLFHQGLNQHVSTQFGLRKQKKYRSFFLSESWCSKLVKSADDIDIPWHSNSYLSKTTCFALSQVSINNILLEEEIQNKSSFFALVFRENWPSPE